MTTNDTKQRPNAYVDTHCHLYQDPLSQDTVGVGRRALDAGVQQVIIPAYDRPSWDQMPVRESNEGFLPALGIHPWVANEFDSTEKLHTMIADLRTRLVQSRAVAIGEIGLDTKVESAALATQIPLLEAQLELAIELNLPVLLHCRGAFDSLLSVLANYNQKVRGVLHAFSRGSELGGQLITSGLYLGFGGHLTRLGAKRARQSATELPLERLILETDAPNLGLEGIPAEKVEPAHIPVIAQAMADLRGVPLATISDATTANARTLFNLPPPQPEN